MIFSKTILKAQLTIAHDKNQTNSEDLPDRTLQLSILNVFKDTSHIDCYNFIQKYKDYFAISGFLDRH